MSEFPLTVVTDNHSVNTITVCMNTGYLSILAVVEPLSCPTDLSKFLLEKNATYTRALI